MVRVGEMRVVFNKFADRVAGYDVYALGVDEVVMEFAGSGWAPNIVISMRLEDAKYLAAMLVATVRHLEQRRRSMRRNHYAMEHLPENLSWLLEG